MNKLRLAFRAVLFVSITLTLATLSEAQATRTWVSGVGDDTNPCSRTAPCKTFAGAISKTAIGGEISVLDPGGFGAVTITKSITIDGTGVLAGILASGVTGIIINDAKASVRIRGLSINGAGLGITGISVKVANKVTVENCVIDGFTGDGINVSSGIVFVRNTTIRNNAGAGINVATGGQVAITDVSLIFNGTGLVGGPIGGGTLSSFNNVVLYGNKSGDPRPPR